MWKAVPLGGSAAQKAGYPGYTTGAPVKSPGKKPPAAGPKVAMKLYSKAKLKESGARRGLKEEVL